MCERWPSVHLKTAAMVPMVVLALAVWSVKFIRLRRGIEFAHRYWSTPRGRAGGLLYVALGDSTAQGVGASRPERGYVGLLADRLGAATGEPVRLINLSVSGARINDVLERQLPTLSGHRPADLVTVAIGGNDVNAYDAGTFAAQVERLTAALPQGTFIADVPYFMHGHWERDAQLAAAVVTRSAEKRGLTVVPLHEALRQQGWSAMLNQFAADLFHPNDRGYRVWADTFWTTIVPLTPVPVIRTG